MHANGLTPPSKTIRQSRHTNGSNDTRCFFSVCMVKHSHSLNYLSFIAIASVVGRQAPVILAFNTKMRLQVGLRYKTPDFLVYSVQGVVHTNLHSLHQTAEWGWGMWMCVRLKQAAA